MESEEGRLHPLEVAVLNALTNNHDVGLPDLVETSGLGVDQIRRALSWLSSKGLVSITEESKPYISPHYTKPPELVLIELIEARGYNARLDDLAKLFNSNSEFSAALGRAIQKGWVHTTPNQGFRTATLIIHVGKTDVDRFLARVVGGLSVADVSPDEKPVFEDLLRRNLIKLDEKKSLKISITPKGIDARNSAVHANYIERVTPEILSFIRHSGIERRLRPIDVESSAPEFHPGRRHPVKEIIAEVREVYLSMGFKEIVGDSVQPAFWNFDALFTPQDHPARELQDTFYVKGMRDQRITRSGVVANVAAVHESGWQTGSKGWRYKWDVEEARRLVLRTHNTAVTIQATKDSAGAATRVFSVARVYRNESLDYKHLAELHQMEGIVVGDGLNLRHLMGILTKFYGKLGMSGVKLWPSYFPYTEPSMQVMVYYDKVGKWLEMGGSGIFRPEVTWPLGVKKPVIAWGCGLERLLMLRLGMEDIRDLYNNDLGWLRERREIASSQDKF